MFALDELASIIATLYPDADAQAALARGRAAGAQAVGNRSRRYGCAAMRYTGNDLLIVRDHISARRSAALLVAPTRARRRHAASDSIRNPVPRIAPSRRMNASAMRTQR